MLCRYAPKLNQAKQWWRWLTSFVVFDSFGAFATNSLLFASLTLHVESRFTTRRTILLILLAGVGGNFFDAAFGVRRPGPLYAGAGDGCSSGCGTAHAATGVACCSGRAGCLTGAAATPRPALGPCPPQRPAASEALLRPRARAGWSPRARA